MLHLWYFHIDRHLNVAHVCKPQKFGATIIVFAFVLTLAPKSPHSQFDIHKIGSFIEAHKLFRSIAKYLLFFVKIAHRFIATEKENNSSVPLRVETGIQCRTI